MQYLKPPYRPNMRSWDIEMNNRYPTLILHTSTILFYHYYSALTLHCSYTYYLTHLSHHQNHLHHYHHHLHHNTFMYQYYYYYYNFHYYVTEPRPTAPYCYRGDADEANEHTGGVSTDRATEYSTPRIDQVRRWIDDDNDDDNDVVEQYDHFYHRPTSSLS